MLKKLTLTILLFFALANISYAFTIPQHDKYVTDVVKVLSVEQEQALEDKIYSIRQQTANEIAVLIIPSTEGEDISMLANEIGNSRGVGSEKFDNGIMMLIAIDDRNRFTAVGYGLEGTLPDAIVKRIGENNLPEYFKQGLYFEGIYKALQDIEGYMVNDPTIKEYYENRATNRDDTYDGLMVFLGILLAIIFFRKKRPIRKNALFFLGIGGGFGVIFWLIAGSLLFLGLGYFYLLIGILITQARGFGILGGGGRGGGGGGSFGGFGGGSFGGGGGGGRR